MSAPVRLFRVIIYSILPVAIALYLFYPLMSGRYSYMVGEYGAYKSFMVNFIESIKNGSLPAWNEYVGCGHPAVYLGNYPLNQNALFYALFGFNDGTYYVTKFLGLAILFYTFLLGAKYLNVGYWTALVGSLVYFSLNLAPKAIVAETIGNLLFVYPLLMFFIVKIVSEPRMRNILTFSLFYIFWLSGGHIVYTYMHIGMMLVFFWITAAVYQGRMLLVPANLARYMGLCLVLFALPLITVLYQYYFTLDAIMASNRIKEGLIVSPFALTAWQELARSFRSSTYFWWGLALLVSYFIFGKKRIIISRRQVAVLFAVIIILTVARVRFAQVPAPIADFVPMLDSTVFRVALLTFFAIHVLFNRKNTSFSAGTEELAMFAVLAMLLSHYFYSPENIPGYLNGYDFDLFRELSVPAQFVFIIAVFYSVKEYKGNKMIKAAIWSLVFLYFLRSHFTIPIMRFTGIVWYATRDNSIFSVLFSVLFMFGLRRLFWEFIAAAPAGERYVQPVKYAAVTILILMLVRSSYYKFYEGPIHRFVFPDKIELADTPDEKNIMDGKKELASLREKLLELDRKANRFYRIFSPENNYHYLAGSVQDLKVREAAMYGCAISSSLYDFFKYTVLGKHYPDGSKIRNAVPYCLFTKHVHAGLGVRHTEIAYDDCYMFEPIRDAKYLREENVSLMLEFMRVKYLVVGPEFSEKIKTFNSADYELISAYPVLELNVYEVKGNNNYSPLAFYSLGKGETYDEAFKKLNAESISDLKGAYSRLIFPDDDTSGFKVLEMSSGNEKKQYEVRTHQKGILVDFGSWNSNWSGKINGNGEEIRKAFRMFRGIKIDRGMSTIELLYNPKYFKIMFLISMMALLVYIAAFFAAMVKRC